MARPQWTVREIMIAVGWISMGMALAKYSYTPTIATNPGSGFGIAISGAVCGYGVGVLNRKLRFEFILAGFFVATTAVVFASL